SQPEPDDRGILGCFAAGACRGPGPQEVGQQQAAHSQRANFEKVATRTPVAVDPGAGSPQIEHGSLLFDVPARPYPNGLVVGRLSGLWQVAGFPLGGIT